MSERFRRFQAAWPEEACLVELMRLRHGGTSLVCPACGRAAAFLPRPKLRAFACEHCNYLLQPAAGTPLENRRTPLQLWLFAVELMSEQPGKAAALLAREAQVPLVKAKRLVDELEALQRKGTADWISRLAPSSKVLPPVQGGPAIHAASASASRPERDLSTGPRSTGRLVIAGLAAGVACFVAVIAAFAHLRSQRQERPSVETVDPSVEAALPALKDGPARPSLILSSVEQDLEGARQAAQFALDNDPSLAEIKPLDEAPQAQVPVNQLQLPSNILLVPPKAAGPSSSGPAGPGGAPQPPPMISSGDPDQVVSFGPIKIRRHLVDTIVRASKIVGADPTLLMAVADKESSFSTAVKAQTSSATGLYQFIEQTWLGVIYEFGARHGLAAEAKMIGRSGRQFVVSDAAQRQRILDMRREPYISALLAAEMLKRDTLRLENALGRHLTGGEIYLIHFLGPDAAQTFIETMEETPGVKAAELLPKPAQANRPIFYTDAGGETKTLSVSEVHKKFNDMIKVRLDRYSAVRPGSGGGGTARPPPRK